MRVPRKAIVLAAGFGSRLSPLTLDCPKPLVPLHGKPMIAHVLLQLREWGVREVLVNIHHLAGEMVREVPEWCPEGMQLNFSFEPEILGTGGGLRRMRWFVAEEPLWVCNADVVQNLNPLPLMEAYEREKPLACLWMVPDAGPRSVKVEKGRVVDFRGGGVTFSGLHLMSPKLWSYLPDQNFSSVITGYECALATGETILGVEVPGSVWADVGTPDQLLEAAGDSVIFPGGKVEAGAQLTHAIVGPGARVRKGVRASGLIVSPHRGLSETERGWLPEVEAVEVLSARGSDRGFRRIFFRGGTDLVMASGSARPENARFAGHARFLAKRGIRVPGIVESRKQGAWLRVEDLGQIDLRDRLLNGSVTRNRTDMANVLKMTARLHGLRVPAGVKLEAPFDAALFAWERTLFREQFLLRHDSNADAKGLESALTEVAKMLEDQPRVLLHRDLQCTNIMWVDREPALIDFQGMRPGPAAYDLGSLLADPYVGRTKEEQREALALYNRHAGRPVDEEVYALGAVQRLAQALGAYGRLGAIPETRRFLKYIPEAVRQMELWAEDERLKKWAKAFLEGQEEENPL
ncbi:MAG: sugar phosphate nucleotidyltransferase [Kiritimatiellia bacterium]